MDKYSDSRTQWVMNTVGIVIAVVIMAPNIFAQYSYIPVTIPMRDGKYLAADVYTIDSLSPKPVILIQTPYDKTWYHYIIGNPDWQVPFDSINYNYLVVDWRGFYGSAAAESIGYDRGLDGYDLIEWIALQPWSNGRVGTWGASALGVIQFMTARHKPPHLSCCVPVVADAKSAYRDYYYGGDYLQELTRMRDSLGFAPESLILAHYTYDIYWIIAEMLTSYPESIEVPMLIVTGWYDHNDDAPLEMFYALRDSSAPSVRDKHKLMVGPWTHSCVGRLEQGELTYPNAVDSLRGISFRIFDFYLRQLSNGYDTEPAIRYYMLGENVWRETEDWYVVSDRTDTLYCSSNSILSSSPPGSVVLPDSFYYDPRDPCPSIGGNRFDPFNPAVIVGPRDQRDSVENRDDVLLYSTPLLTEPITVAGDIRVRLTVSSNCEDTDFSVRLTDVYPDERSMLITEGIRRMRFRSSYSSEELMVPGDTYEVYVELKNIAYTILPDHRLRMIISSSDYPIFHANLNNGDSLYVHGDTVVALNKIYHSPGAISMIIMKTCNNTQVTEYKWLCPSDPLCIYTIVNERIRFAFHATRSAWGDIRMYDCSGRKIKTVYKGPLTVGLHEYDTKTKDLSSGIYFIAITFDGRVNTTKIVVTH